VTLKYSDYTGFAVHGAEYAECADCDQEIPIRDDDLESILDAVDNHVCKA
jgi:hypothetical protein